MNLPFILGQVVEAVPTVPVPLPHQDGNGLLWATVITSSFALLTTIVGIVRDVMKRIQDRADRALELEAIHREGKLREQNILQHVKQVEVKADKAYDTANGHNEKLAQMGNNVVQAVKKVEEVMEKPTKVLVVNPPTQPVHTTKDLQVPDGSPGEGA